MAKAKMIEVGNGYAVQFLQRARGEETPYFQAKVFKLGVEVGYASNGGRGGSTMIRGRSIRDGFKALVNEGSLREEFKALVHEAAKAVGIVPEESLLKYEPEAVVLDYALCKGYDRGCGQITLNEFVQGYAH